VEAHLVTVVDGLQFHQEFQDTHIGHQGRLTRDSVVLPQVRHSLNLKFYLFTSNIRQILPVSKKMNNVGGANFSRAVHG